MTGGDTLQKAGSTPEKATGAHGESNPTAKQIFLEK